MSEARLRETEGDLDAALEPLAAAESVFDSDSSPEIRPVVPIRARLLAAHGRCAVVLFPAVNRQNETLALGFVASRIREAAIIFVGIVSLLAVVTLRQELAAGADVDPDSVVALGSALVAVRDATFVLGPRMAAANALLLGKGFRPSPITADLVEPVAVPTPARCTPGSSATP